MSTTLERLEYGYDRDSRRTWRRRSLTTGEDYAYGYDGLSQVVNAARGSLNLNATAIGGVAEEAEGWDYDPTGNWKGYRIEADGAVTLDQVRMHDQGNRLTQIEGNLVDGLNPIRVDRVGRMLEVPPDAAGDWEEPLKLEWDAWNRVVLVRREDMVWSYQYDGLFRRITRSGFAGDRHTYYSDAWRPLEDRDGSAAADPNVQYFWGARHRDDLVRRDRATESDGVLNETRYVLMDYFSPAAITDEDGEVKERYAFSAFGVRRILAPDFTPRDASECGLEFAFQGQFEDAESGFLNYGFRYYSPYLGRWLSKDPITENGGPYLYSFVDNIPTTNVDLLGLVGNEVKYEEEYKSPPKGGLGTTDANSVRVDHECICFYKKYHLALILRGTVTITVEPSKAKHLQFFPTQRQEGKYVVDPGIAGTEMHERFHGGAWRSFFSDIAKKLEKFEMAYESQEECDEAAAKAQAEYSTAFKSFNDNQSMTNRKPGDSHPTGWNHYPPLEDRMIEIKGSTRPH
jgi:RHS repeat-associated protein